MQQDNARLVEAIEQQSRRGCVRSMPLVTVRTMHTADSGAGSGEEEAPTRARVLFLGRKRPLFYLYFQGDSG